MGKSEADISRRLSIFRKLGLVEYNWVRRGEKNIKLYSMKPKRLILDLSEGMILLGEGGRRREILGDTEAWKHPETEYFVGRNKELEKLAHVGPGETIVVSGLPGIGKTSLVAKYLDMTGEESFWHTITESDLLDTILKKIALYLSTKGDERLLQYLRSGAQDMYGLQRILVKSIDRLEATVVFDDYHRIKDQRIAEVIEYISKNINRAKLIVITRKTPAPTLFGLKTDYLVLGGLSPKETKTLISSIVERELSNNVLAEINAALKGYTVLVKWFADIASKKGLAEALELLYKGKVMERFWRYIYDSLTISEKKIIGSLVCMNGELERGFVEEILGEEVGRKALMLLSDKNYIFLSGYRILLNELIQNLTPPDQSIYCQELQHKYIEYLLNKKTPRNFLDAFRIAIDNGYLEQLPRLIEYRVTKIKYGILDYLTPYEKLLEKAIRKTRDSYARALLLSELSVIYLSRGDNKRSYELIMQSLPLLKKRASPEILSLIYSRLIQMDPKKARTYYYKAIGYAKLIKDHSFKYMALSHIHSNMALYYTINKQPDSAIDHGLKSLQYAMRSGDPIEYTHSEFQWLILDGIRKDTLDTERLTMIREMSETLGLPYHYYDYIVFFEILGYLLEKRWKEAEDLISYYKRRLENIGSRKIPCHVYALALFISAQRHQRPPYKSVFRECLVKAEKECEFSVIAGVLGLMENWYRGMEICTWFDMLYLEKLFFSTSYELWEKFMKMKKYERH